MANVRTSQPLRREHPVRTGSVLKMAVGTVVLQLADERKLTLEDPVSRHVEGVPQGGEITLRMLGNHTSGLSNALADAGFRKRLNKGPQQTVTHPEIKAVSFAQHLNAQPGKEFCYSNTNTILLAEVIGAVTGRDWKEELQRRIFTPLRMKHSLIAAGPRLPGDALHGYRFGERKRPLSYGKDFMDVSAFNPSWAGAGGDWVTTLDDLLKLTRALASGALLSAQMREEQCRWVETGVQGFRYGFCLGEWDRRIRGHAGDVPGFSAFAGWLSQTGTVIVVLSNLSNLADKSNPAERMGMVLAEFPEGEGDRGSG